MVISVNEGGLVVVEDCHVGLERLHNVIQESVVLLDVLLKFEVNDFEASPVLPLGLAFELHDSVDGIDELVLELTGCLNALHAFVQLDPPHQYYIEREDT